MVIKALIALTACEIFDGKFFQLSTRRKMRTEKFLKMEVKTQKSISRNSHGKLPKIFIDAIL